MSALRTVIHVSGRSRSSDAINPFQKIGPYLRAPAARASGMGRPLAAGRRAEDRWRDAGLRRSLGLNAQYLI